jgi:hypothetical protein
MAGVKQLLIKMEHFILSATCGDSAPSKLIIHVMITDLLGV